MSETGLIARIVTLSVERRWIVLALTLIALLAAGPIMRRLGTKIEAMITRLLGVILAALAAQIVIDGLIGAFTSGGK